MGAIATLAFAYVSAKLRIRAPFVIAGGFLMVIGYPYSSVRTTFPFAMLPPSLPPPVDSVKAHSYQLGQQSTPTTTANDPVPSQ